MSESHHHVHTVTVHHHFDERFLSLLSQGRSLAEMVTTIGDLKTLVSNIDMKMSELKGDLRGAVNSATKAFGEIKKKLDELDKKVTEVEAGVTDPEVTDEDLLTTVGELKAITQQLDDLVPDVTGAELPTGPVTAHETANPPPPGMPLGT